MGLIERKYMQETQPEGPPTFLQRLNEFGERHAKLIIFLSTALIIVTVLIVADTFWKRSRFERALRDLDAATTVEAVEKLRDEHADSPLVLPRILYRLGNLCQEEAARSASDAERTRDYLQRAVEAYDRFKKEFPQDPLSGSVTMASLRARQNLEFVETARQSLLKLHTLAPHPLAEAETKDSPIRFGPIRQPNPEAVIVLPENREVRIELFEDEAHNAVAEFIDLCEKGFYKGVGFVKDEEAQQLVTLAKATETLDYQLPLDLTARSPAAGIVAAVRSNEGPRDQAGRFLILLSDDAKLEGHTLFGQVKGGLPFLRELTPQDGIREIRIEKKRDHPYVSEKIRP